MVGSIYTTQEAGSDRHHHDENDGATAGREAPIFDVYSDSDDAESSLDNNLDLIFVAVIQLRAKSCTVSQPS